MAILMNNVMNNEAVKGFSANMAMRNGVVKALYSKSIVIRKFEVTKDDNGEMQVSFKYGTIGQNPVAEAFGLDTDVRINNLPVEVKDMNDKVKAQKINVDGVKYVFCSSLITIECEDNHKIEEYAADGFTFTDEEGNELVYRVAGSSPSNEKHAVKYYFKVTEDNKQGIITVTMKYGPDKERVISGIRKISKPGLKSYAKANEIPRVLGGLGIAIISTSKGVISDKEARKLGIGGEVICYVW